MSHALARSLCLIAIALPAIASAQTPATLDKIKQSGAMTLAYRESSIPFSYLGADAQPTGFGYEICQKIADNVKKATGRNDLKLQYQAVTSANRIPLLQNGTIDIECGSTTNNSERGKQVAFAINYFYTGTRFLVKTGTNVNKLSDLAGKQVVSTTGTTNFQIIRRLNEEQKVTMLLVEQNANMALKTAHYGYVLEVGRIVLEGACEKLVENEDVREFYLGHKETAVRGKKRWKRTKRWR